TEIGKDQFAGRNARAKADLVSPVHPTPGNANMTTPKKRLTRRGAIARLAGLSGLAVATQAGALPGGATPSAQAQQPQRPSDAAPPTQAGAGPGLELFDPAMLQIMDRHALPGAPLAIAKNGKLVLARGYGWANAAPGDPAHPDTLFGLASLSKTITA